MSRPFDQDDPRSGRAIRVSFKTLSLDDARDLSREERRKRLVAERRLQEARVRLAEHAADRLDREIEHACAVVAAAVDHLDEVRGEPDEIMARRSVLRHAGRLRNLIARKR